MTAMAWSGVLSALVRGLAGRLAVCLIVTANSRPR